MFQTFLNILGIIGIVVVAAFVIVFLSDLFISIVDGTNGIFFKRNKDKNDYDDDDDDEHVRRPKLLNKPREEDVKRLESSEERTFEKQTEKVEERTYVDDKNYQREVDMEEAKREEQLAKQANANRQNVVNQRTAQAQPAQNNVIVTPAPAPAPAKKEEAKKDNDDMDSLIAEISRQTLQEIEKENEQNKVKKQQAELAQKQKEQEENLAKKQKELEEEYERKQQELEEKYSDKQQELEEKYAQKQQELEEKLSQKDQEKQEEIAQKQQALEDELEKKQQGLEDELEKKQQVLDEELAKKQQELEEKYAQKEQEIDKAMAQKRQELEEELAERQKTLEDEIERLKAQISSDKNTIKELEIQVQNANNVEVKTVKVPMGKKEELESRLEVLRQRLKDNEKELSANKKEYLPLRRVNQTLENDKKKLRRKEAIVAKQKVVLYGVNNYVDIDEEKAKKLSEEIDLLEGLRLSVQHCEEVMQKNKDRYPILERTNKFLVKSNFELKEDIAKLEAQIKELEDNDDDSDDIDALINSTINDVTNGTDINS